MKCEWKDNTKLHRLVEDEKSEKGTVSFSRHAFDMFSFSLVFAPYFVSYCQSDRQTDRHHCFISSVIPETDGGQIYLSFVISTKFNWHVMRIC